MIKVAIVDDVNSVCSQVEKFLNNAANKKGIKLDISVYYSGERLCEDISNGEDFDLLFMDIELELMNGIQAVKFIREIIGNERMRIVFISANTEYANDLFEHDVMNFLRKPITYKCIEDVLNKFIRVYYNDNRAFTFNFKHKTYRINYDEILYFESDKRVVNLFTLHGEYMFYDTIENVMLKIDDTRFCRIHQSYIVNLLFVDVFKLDSIEMKNHKIFPVSKSYRENIIKMQLDMELGVI